MRELAFALEYDGGVSAVADALAEHPEARIRSLSLHATDEEIWRVDHATGSNDALEAIERAVRDGDYYADCLASSDCGATLSTRVLDETGETLILYSHWVRTATCDSVPHIARDHLGDGVLFETRHETRHYTWRVIHPGDGDGAAFFDALEDAVGDGVQIEMLRAGATGEGPETGSDGNLLPPAQAAALRAAVEHGYYETPRDVDAGELANHLEIPRSTLSYRLRRAEEQLAKQYVAATGVGREPTATL